MPSTPVGVAIEGHGRSSTAQRNGGLNAVLVAVYLPGLQFLPDRAHNESVER